MQNPLAEQIKLGSPISLPLDQLEASDLTFGLALRPGQIEASTNCGFIPPKSSG
ncbi:hypothetical protein ccbrp13_34250 [Ktedonobacteria bacterium brp13]|nr:hypothetical protein ccbrp13_34250 [Ktedonobacteria bacterium brp13]